MTTGSRTAPRVREHTFISIIQGLGGLLALFLMTFATLASAAIYVGSDTTDVKPGDRAVIAHPQPVQLLFQFETKGAPNARATKYVMQQVIDAVKNSGVFSDVSDGPTANGAILNIVIDNVVTPKELQKAEAKGFATGATLFLAGSNVQDNYVCTVDYVSGPNASKITRTAHHSLIVQMGLINSAPANAVKASSYKDGVATMVRQIVSNPLNDVAKDPAFLSVPTTAVAPAPEPVSTPAPSTSPTAPAQAPAPTGAAAAQPPVAPPSTPASQR